MEPIKDAASNRFLIDKGTPINGGIWEGKDGICTFVDTSIGKQIRLRDIIEKTVHPLAISGEGPLTRISEMAIYLIPINERGYQEMVNNPKKLDRYGLESFFSHKKDDGTEVGGGGFDQQALLAGLLMEEYYRKKYPKLSMTRILGNSPKVGISRNERGHAVVEVMTKNRDRYKFDPSQRDTDFVLSKK